MQQTGCGDPSSYCVVDVLFICLILVLMYSSKIGQLVREKLQVSEELTFCRKVIIIKINKCPCLACLGRLFVESCLVITHRSCNYFLIDSLLLAVLSFTLVLLARPSSSSQDSIFHLLSQSDITQIIFRLNHCIVVI